MSAPQAAPQSFPLPDASAPLSEISRLTGVFVDPKRAFADIVARPRWYVPVILVSLASICLIFLYSQHVGFERLIQQSLDQNPRTQNMTGEQRAQAMNMGLTIGRTMAYVSAVAAPTISVLVVAAVLMFMANSMLGAQIRYPQMAAIAAYSFLTGLVSAALSIIVMFVRSPDEFDLRNPLAFNLGAFLNADTTPKWLVSLGSSIDVFAFWTMALLAIGIVAASKKVSFGKALVAVLIPWGIFVVCKVGWAAMFG